MPLADPGNDKIVELLISVREDINIMTCEYGQMRRLAREACEALNEMRAEFRGYDLPYGSKAYLNANVFLARPEVQQLMTREGK